MTETAFIPWLMEAETPTIPYRTLVDLVGLPAEQARVSQARKAIMKSGPVPAILDRQSEAGSWSGERSYYTPKYTSTHWSLVLLTELDVEGSNPRFQRGVHYMLNTTAADLDHQLKTHTLGMSCFWGNMLRYACHADLHEDALVKDLVSYLTLDLDEGPCLCVHNGGQACAWGMVRTLWGLAALPKELRSRKVHNAVELGVKFLLDTHPLVEADYPSGKRGETSSLWFKLNFPLFYQADILLTLRVLDELDGLEEPGARPALDWLEQRRGRNGTWSSSSPYRQRTWPELGGRAETDRWVSLHASRILLHSGRITEDEEQELNTKDTREHEGKRKKIFRLKNWEAIEFESESRYTVRRTFRKTLHVA
jgi:hypothetical protein